MADNKQNGANFVQQFHIFDIIIRLGWAIYAMVAAFGALAARTYGNLGFGLTVIIGILFTLLLTQLPNMSSWTQNRFSIGKFRAVTVSLLAALLLIFFNATEHLLPIIGETHLTPNSDHLVSGATIAWDGELVTFEGRYSRSGDSELLYVTCGTMGGQPLGNTTALNNDNINLEQRIAVSRLERFVRGEQIKEQIGVMKSVDGNEMVLRLGDGKHDNGGLGVTWGNYLCEIILVNKEYAEDTYPFILISRS
jgi:hypothetical protein